MEPDYISANRHAYDSLAADYRARSATDQVRDVPLIQPFIQYLKARFGHGARVLDIGPGSGVNLAMFYDTGLIPCGIDISGEMLLIAKETCPAADLQHGDFLTVPYIPASFHGIFSKASIHLFPKPDAIRVIRKVKELLVPDGMFYVTTTAALFSTEEYSEKTDYPHRVIRYRKSWTREELLEGLAEAGLEICYETYNREPERGKLWLNVWAVKLK